jgi:hypothetical protein
VKTCDTPEAEAGVTETAVGWAAFSVIVKLTAPAATELVSCAALLLAAAVKLIVALPVPLVGLTVNQLAEDAAVHAHPAGAARLTLTDPPVAGRLVELGVNEVTQ